jgi:hypothetical protein
MEISTEENEAVVREICELVEKSGKDNKTIETYQQVVYDIDYLLLEANSGASFEQYFRWATIDEIKRIEAALNTVGLKDISKLTHQAIQIAFPNGMPKDNDEKDDLTDWSEDQEESLESLFETLEESNGRITNILAEYAKSQA